MKARISKDSGVWFCKLDGTIMAYIAESEFSIGAAIDWFMRNGFLRYSLRGNQ